MLVLSRKAGEQIVIDDRIQITVTAVDGGRIKIGVVAPADVRVDRGEIAGRAPNAVTSGPAVRPCSPRAGRPAARRP